MFFNLVEFLKYNSSEPEIYDIPGFLEIIKNSIKFNFFLIDDNGKSYKIDDVKEMGIFDNQDILSFLIKIDASSVAGKYYVRGEILYTDKFYDFLSIKQLTSDINSADRYQENIYINQLKNILDIKYTNQCKPYNLNQQYEFISEYVLIDNKQTKISNLYDIFSETVKKEDFDNFIGSIEVSKGQSYDGFVPLTKYLFNDQEIELDYNFINKNGNISSYLNLSMSLLNQRDFDYKQIDFLKNIFNNDKKLSKKSEKNIKMFETISSLQSDSRIKQVFSNQTITEILDSDILYISSFFDNFNINIDNFWASDYKLLPIYLLEIMTTYKIYYLKEINKFSMFEVWSELTNQERQNLQKGKYLCTFAADNVQVQNNIIENYFILEV